MKPTKGCFFDWEGGGKLELVMKKGGRCPSQQGQWRQAWTYHSHLPAELALGLLALTISLTINHHTVLALWGSPS